MENFVTGNQFPVKSESQRRMERLKKAHPGASWNSIKRVWQCGICKKSKREADDLTQLVCK